ncbi:zinc ribbon domain-containing protein, partial [Candidatus Thorarchaeota archaeon]
MLLRSCLLDILVPRSTPHEYSRSSILLCDIRCDDSQLLLEGVSTCSRGGWARHRSDYHLRFVCATCCIALDCCRLGKDDTPAAHVSSVNHRSVDWSRDIRDSLHTALCAIDPLVDENVHNRFICTVLSYNTRKAGRCYYMVGQLQCPKCGMKLGKGSTFCINCGHRVENTNQTIVEPSTEEGPQTEEVVLEETELPPIEKTAVERASTNDSVNADEQCEPEEGCLPPAEELSWEDEMPQPTPAPAVARPVEPTPIDDDTIPKAVDIEELSWEEGIDEVKVGNPFKEVEPPRVVTEEIDMTDAVEHLFPEKKDDATREAVAHLFPEGRGSTSSSFIDVVVGKPDR